MTPPGYSLRDAGVAYHAATGDVIAFGGVGGAQDEAIYPTDATLSWSEGTWQRLEPTVSPPVRRHPLLVGDQAGAVLLFGGSSWLSPALRPRSKPSCEQPYRRVSTAPRVTRHADAWRWDGTSWQSLDCHDYVSGVITYDQARRCPVLVGTVGSAADTRARRATWAWSGQAWTLLTPSVPGDDLLGLAGDPRTGELVGIAGANHSTPPRTRPALGRPARFGFARVWVLDEGQWRPEREPFPEQVSGVVVTEPATDEVLAITARGHTWRREAGRWVSLPTRRSVPATEHQPGSELIAVRAPSAVLLVITHPSAEGETWLWDGTDWHAQTDLDQPAI